MHILNTIYTHARDLILDLLFPKQRYEKVIATLSTDALSEKLFIEDVGGVMALFSYRDPLIRHLIWRLKYRGDRRAARLIADVLHSYLCEELADEVLLGNPNVRIMPIPLSKKRARERGFNQITLVLDELKKLGEYTIDTRTLVKTKHTDPQTGIRKRTEREKNIVGVFGVREDDALKDALKGAHVILIDDVVTTGSTLREAEKTLTNAGAESVLCIAFAH